MSDCRAIFSLIAMGRITPAEAERLLAVANEPNETVVALIACVAAIFLMQILLHGLAPEMAHFLKSLLPEITAAAYQVQTIVNELLGGLL
jgi:hypothetical protein